jgi:hypothetical protein
VILLTARLSGADYSASQMSYDLRRLRLNGLIRRIEHTRAYILTPDGQRLAIFYTKVYNRLLRPLGRRWPAASPARTTPGARRDRPPRQGLHRPGTTQACGLKHDSCV